MNPSEVEKILEVVSGSLEKNELLKIKLSGNCESTEDLDKIVIKPVVIKKSDQLQFVYSYPTQDKTKNYTFPDALINIEELAQKFENISIVTIDYVFQINSKVGKLFRSKNQNKTKKTTEHNKQKNRLIAQNSKYLELLGVTNASGNISSGKANKFKQINRYVEIMSGLISEANLSETYSILDVGSGKGYLTFSLYQHLTERINREIKIKGIELRKELVEKCNQIAEKCNYENLSFAEGDISHIEKQSADVLVALHACDTATDDAISIGIKSNAKLIVCSPCCHKQIRSQMKRKIRLSSIVKYGIIKERQAEIVTDLIRSLILEYHGYKTKIMEFISTEHTAKNLLIVGIKNERKIDKQKIISEIETLKAEFGIEYHYLERALEN